MKKITLLSFMMIFLMAGKSQSQTAGYLDADFFRPEMIKQLDSIYEYNWVSNNWDAKTKNYKIHNGNGLVIQDLYLKINPISSQWSNYLRYVNTYEAENPFPATITGQFWTAANEWITYQYAHNLSKKNADTLFEKTWDQQRQKFTGGDRYLATYDANKNVSSRISQKLDTITNNWLNSTKVNFSYNTSNIQTEEIFMIWGDTSWMNNFRQLDSFDANNALVEHSEYTWVDSTSTWANVIRDQYTNNLQGKPVYSLNQSWNNVTSSWDSIEQTDYSYSTEGLLFSATTRQFDPLLLTWNYHVLKIYTYNNGQLITESGSIWNPLTSNYIANQFIQYDSVNQLIDTYERFIDFSTYLITGGSRDTYGFNSNSDLITHVNQQWNTVSGEWVNNLQEVYTYDEFRYLLEKLTQNWTASVWTNSTLARYYYTEVQGINDLEMHRYCSFPNPMRQGTTIQCAELQSGHSYQLSLFSLSGAMVWKQTFTGGETVTVSANVASGMYIIRLSENGKPLYQDKVMMVK